jgi:large subunit ribosomal protein L18
MARGPRYKVPRRRRREGKTNYYKRYRMVLSGKLRLVVRRTNKYVEAKIVKFNPRGDETLVVAHSIELMKKYGWKGSGKSLPAAYLTGLLIGLRAKEKGIEEAIVDLGVYRSVKASRLYAVVKGALDAGLKIPVSEEVLPPEERIRGEHIASYANKLKEENPEKYKRQFSELLERGLSPEELTSHFEFVKNNILGGAGK